RPVAVAAPEVEVGGRDVADGTVTVPKGSFALVDLGFSPSVPPNLEVAVRGPEGAESIATRPTPVSDSRVRVKIAAPAGAPSEAALGVTTSDGTELAVVPMQLRAASGAAGASSALQRVPESTRSVRVGAVAGGASRTDRREAAFLETGSAAGLMVGYLPNDHFALEVMPRLTVLPRAGLRYGIDTRALFALVVGDVRPYIGGGFGLHTLEAGRVRPTLGVAGGADWWVAGRWGLRGGLASDLALRDGAAIWMPRVMVGVLYRWQ
ncbi:MAG: hypothetical protein ABEK29_00445, partial [Bradymonadaceae bacterium]